MLAIEINHLVKNYGRIEALKGVDLRVKEGEIFGLLGQNGAGKTTMVKILLGITHSSGGEARLLNEPAGTTAVRKRVGYLPEDHRFPEYHTAASLLRFYGTLYEMPGNLRKQRSEEMLDIVELTGRENSKIRTYSKGMKQRLGIAQALFHNPDLIFLDEPTDGVDPVGRRQIRDIMMKLKKRGVTIFLNSHLLGEVEQICDRVAILHKGEKAREGSVVELTKSTGIFVIGLAPEQELPEGAVASLGYQVKKVGHFWHVRVDGGRTIDPVVDLIQRNGLNLRHLSEQRETLEDLFMQQVAKSKKQPPRKAEEVLEPIVLEPEQS